MERLIFDLILQKKQTMKNLLFIICLISFSTLNAQVHPHALGLRAGGSNFGTGGELSYQMGINEVNRLELDLGYRGRNYGHGVSNSTFALSAIYHWAFNITEGLNWYIGPGAQLGFYRYNNYYNEKDKLYTNGSGIAIGIGGQIGLEYDFSDLDVPLLLSLDTRPMWSFSNYYGGFGYGGAFAIRYIF